MAVQCSPGQLQAGAARVDITPPMGTQLAGMIGMYRPAETLLDPVHASVLVLASGDTRLCLLSLEILAVADDWVGRIRHEARERFGLQPEAVMVHAVQNHAAPMIGARMDAELCDWLPENGRWLLNDAGEYNPYAVERIMQGIQHALDALTPVRMGMGRGMDNRVAFNRRYVMRDGTTVTQPSAAQFKDILHSEGPIDPEVGVVCFTSASLKRVAMLLHHTCHPVHGVSGRHISAGWPGAWRKEVEAAHGQGCVPLVVNGCCGNVHHRNHLDPDQRDEPGRIGRLLAETTQRALQGLTYTNEVPLAARSVRVPIPHRQVSPEDLQEAKDLLARHPEPMWKNEEHTSVDWAWCYATSVLDVHALAQRSPQYPYEVQAFRIGDVAIVALTGEPFVQGGLRLKLESPAPYAFPAHMSNGYCGYLPTPGSFGRGGYETKTALWSRLAPEALDTVIDAAVELVGEMYENS